MTTYVIEGLPTGANAAAFAPPPPPVVTPASQSSYGLVSARIHGQLATWQPSPFPAAMHSAWPTTQPGNQAGAQKPVVYWNEARDPRSDPIAGGVAIPHHEDLPIPAGSYQGGSPVTGGAQQAKPMMRRPVIIGRRQVAWPRAFQRWRPGFGTGASGG